jgi:hypothetical protein
LAPEHGVPLTLDVGAPHFPEVEHTRPVSQPAAGLQVAVHEPPEQCRPRSQSLSAEQTLPQREPYASPQLKEPLDDEPQLAMEKPLKKSPTAPQLASFEKREDGRAKALLCLRGCM